MTNKPCPTCSGPIRETTNLRCETCGQNFYAALAAPVSRDAELIAEAKGCADWRINGTYEAGLIRRLVAAYEEVTK